MKMYEFSAWSFSLPSIRIFTRLVFTTSQDHSLANLYGILPVLLKDAIMITGIPSMTVYRAVVVSAQAAMSLSVSMDLCIHHLQIYEGKIFEKIRFDSTHDMRPEN
jgi:hypothetical protein